MTDDQRMDYANRVADFMMRTLHGMGIDNADDQVDCIMDVACSLVFTVEMRASKSTDEIIEKLRETVKNAVRDEGRSGSHGPS